MKSLIRWAAMAALSYVGARLMRRWRERSGQPVV